jgi:hypothetical protein
LLPEEAEAEPLALVVVDPVPALVEVEVPLPPLAAVWSPDKFVPNTESKSCPMPCMVLQPPSKANVIAIADIRQTMM